MNEMLVKAWATLKVEISSRTRDSLIVSLSSAHRFGLTLFLLQCVEHQSFFTLDFRSTHFLSQKLYTVSSLKHEIITARSCDDIQRNWSTSSSLIHNKHIFIIHQRIFDLNDTLSPLYCTLNHMEGTLNRLKPSLSYRFFRKQWQKSSQKNVYGDTSTIYIKYSITQIPIQHPSMQTEGSVCPVTFL